MKLITGKTLRDVYLKAAVAILEEGQVVSPRGSKTLELAPGIIHIENAKEFVTLPKARRANSTFQLAEALWMIRGSNDLEEIAHYNRVWRYFEDEDNKGILNGAYGERLRDWNGIDQFIEVYEKLKKDPYSRQATMIIFDPERDNELHEDGNYSKDIPCTNYFNFQIRNGKLNMHTVMRSNDLHKGTIYDIPNFIIFQHILAGWLDVEVGSYSHYAASFHIYETDIENFEVMLNDAEDLVDYDKEVGDPRLSMEEFNSTMVSVTSLEYSSRLALSKEFFTENMDLIKKVFDKITNTWWKSVAAQIVMYNYRKLGATKEEFQVFLPYITNEYRKDVQNWEVIKK